MADSVTAVLLLSCPDQKGIVAQVSDFLYRHDGNIIHADQHTDAEEGVFLQRVEWEIDGFGIAREGVAEAFRPIAERFGMTWGLSFSDARPRIAVLASRLPHCLYDVLARWRMDEFQAEIALVVSNHRDLEPIAAQFDVPYVHLPVEAENRAQQEQAVLQKCDEAGVDMIVLARYMQVLGERVVERYRDAMINIHHSFLPAFAGARPYHQAHERGVKVIGATAHYVTRELDEGPIIAQDVAQVSHRDRVADLVRKGRDLEKTVLARAVDLHLRRRVLVYGNKTVVFD